MNISIKWGIPYCDFLNQERICFQTEHSEGSIKDVIQYFLETHREFKIKIRDLKYYENNKLKAYYTLNAQLTTDKEKVKEGDEIAIFFPICGG